MLVSGYLGDSGISRFFLSGDTWGMIIRSHPQQQKLRPRHCVLNEHLVLSTSAKCPDYDAMSPNCSQVFVRKSLIYN